MDEENGLVVRIVVLMYAIATLTFLSIQLAVVALIGCTLLALWFIYLDPATANSL